MTERKGQRVRADDDLVNMDLDGLRRAETGEAVPEGEQAAEPGAAAAKRAEPVEPTYEFTITDKITGKKGLFVSRVPTVADRIHMGRARAKLAGGMPWVSMPEEVQGLINCIAACSFCLIQKPDWFKDVMASMTLHVILVVGEEVLAHHERWFRGLGRMGEGETYRSYVEVTPRVGASVQAA